MNPNDTQEYCNIVGLFKVNGGIDVYLGNVRRVRLQSLCGRVHWTSRKWIRTRRCNRWARVVYSFAHEEDISGGLQVVLKEQKHTREGRRKRRRLCTRNTVVSIRLYRHGVNEKSSMPLLGDCRNRLSVFAECLVCVVVMLFSSIRPTRLLHNAA